jgi:glycosyltransferase involved in cell wall biosynthesis
LAKQLKNLLVYDNLQVAGGAEYVTKVMLKELPFDKLLVNYAKPEVLKILQINNDCVVTIGKSTDSTPLSMISSAYKFWKYKDKNQYDTVLVSGIFAPLIAKNIKARKIIYYCHTPPRFLYDLKAFYKNSLNPLQWLLLRSFSFFYKKLYEGSFHYIHKVFANSKNVQSRLSMFLGVDSEILYPPCNTSYEGKEPLGYFLSTARLEPYKRVDTIVDAFMQTPEKRLIVMSGGSMMEMLKEKARGCSNIQFTGWVDEKQKRELIAHCDATIYIPKDEDFGMSPIESIAAGKYVIGIAEGGLLETITHGVNGYLCNTENIANELLEVIKKADYIRELKVKNQLAKFEKSNFINKVMKP